MMLKNKGISILFWFIYWDTLQVKSGNL